MDAVITQLNSIGRSFVIFALPMLIQSSLLILILLGLNLLLGRKTRAVFRYGLLLLILVKLVLPTTLSAPTGIGYWIGGNFLNLSAQSQISSTPPVAGGEPAGPPPLTTLSQTVDSTVPSVGLQPSTEMAEHEAVPTPGPAEPVPTVLPSAIAITWPTIALLIWLAVVVAMVLLLIQRLLFVRGLIAQSSDADSELSAILRRCCKWMHLKKHVRLRLSPTATSPAVCGLLHPVILLPDGFAGQLDNHHLRAVLLHELAHIKRRDLWANLAQTILQIVYFYNPLLWLANAVIRRVREQAVDEMVLVAMGENHEEYPDTLLAVARLSLARPALSLRLIGVVESKKALTQRIKHIISRPLPKTAKLGLLGLAIVLATAAVLLPMAKGQAKDKKDDLVMESEFTARLAGGVTVELLGVSELHSKAKQWWRPNGTLLDEPPCESLNKKGLPVKRKEIAYELVVRLSGLELLKRRSETPERWEIPEARRVGLGRSGIGNDQAGNPLPSLRITTAIVKQKLKKVTVRFGIVPGLWQKNLSIPAGETSKHKLSDIGIVVQPPYEKQGNAIVTVKVPNQIDSRVTVRVVAVLKDGLVNDGPAWSRDGKIAFMPSSDNYEFIGLGLSDVDHFEIFTGRYRWIEFRNVSLVPGKKTDVQVVTDSGDEQFNTLVRKLRQAPDDDARLLIAIDLERAGRPEAIPHLTEALKQVSFSHPSAARRIVRNIRNLERKNGLPPKNVFDGMYSQVLRTLDSDPTGRRLYAYDLQKADTVYIDSPEQVQETRENRIRRFVSEANSRADLAMILTPKKRLYALRGTRLAPLQIELKLPNVDWTDVRDEVHQSDLKELVVSYHKLKSKYVAGPAPSSQIHPFEPGDLFAVLLPSGQMAVLQTKQITDEPEGVQLAVYYLDPLLALCRNTGVATAITLSIPSEIQPATQAEELLAAAVELVDADETAGRYTWRVNREAPSRMVYGFHSISDTNKMEFIADAKDGIARKNAKDYALEFRREGPNLHLGVADWFFPPDSGGKGKFWDKTSWPNNSTFKTTYVGRAGNLTNAEYVTLWRGDFIREERVVKSILFSARLASQDDPVRRMLDANDPVQALKPLGISDVSKRPSGPLAFGPVIERVINHMGENCMIDFDTGKVFDSPRFEGGSVEALAWAEQNGIDAGGGRQPTIQGLIGFDMIVFPRENTIWDQLQAATLARSDMLKLSKPGNPVFLSGKGGVPVTYTFKTREGGMGILQIVGFTETPKGVKIRYKMVQSVKPKIEREDIEKRIRLIYKLKYADAEDMAKRIETLFSGEAPKLAVVPDKRRKTITLLTDPKTMEEIGRFIKAFDTPIDSGIEKRIPMLYELKYADAEDMAKQIMTLFSGEARKVAVVPDNRRNAIMVLTDQETIKEIEKVIAKLDAPIDSGKVE